MKADILRAVRVITHAWLKTKENPSKEEVYEFVEGLTKRLDNNGSNGILKSVPLPAGAKIVYAEESH